MIRKLLVITGLALFAFTGMTTLSSCEKDAPSLNDSITFQNLNAPYVSLTPTVAPTITTSVTFFARSSVMSNSGGGVEIYIDGNFAGYITSSTSSGISPSCGLSGNVNRTLTTGNHTWYGRSLNGFYDFGTSFNPRSIPITTVTCNKQEVL